MSNKAQEPREGAGACQGGVAFPHSEARLWTYEGALSRLEEESRVAVRGLCSGQYLSASAQAGEDQFTAGPSRGVVCLPEAAKASGRQNERRITAKQNDFERMQTNVGRETL